jgi:hypothetical protein
VRCSKTLESSSFLPTRLACLPVYRSIISRGFLIQKSLFAYHIEALVPTSPHSPNTSQTPQKLNGSKDVHFFSVGSLSGRTLVIYMKKKGVGSCSIGWLSSRSYNEASSWTVYSACSSLLLARSMREQRLRCLSVLDSACGNLVRSGSASIGCVYLIYRRLEFPRLMLSYRTFSFPRSRTISSS